MSNLLQSVSAAFHRQCVCARVCACVRVRVCVRACARWQVKAGAEEALVSQPSECKLWAQKAVGSVPEGAAVPSQRQGFGFPGQRGLERAFGSGLSSGRCHGLTSLGKLHKFSTPRLPDSPTEGGSVATVVALGTHV